MLLLVVQGNEAYLLMPPSWPLLRNKYCIVLIMKLMRIHGGIYKSTAKTIKNLFKTEKNKIGIVLYIQHDNLPFHITG